MNKECISKKPPEPILAEYFERIREKPNIQPKLEEFSSILENDEYRKQCFDEAKKAFLFIYDKEKFNNYLNADPSEEGKKYLKRIRQLGLTVKALYLFFDESHQCPKNFHQFLSSLGEYNDKYELKTSKRVKPQEVIDFNNLEITANFTNDQDFKEYVNEIISQIEELLKNSILSIKDFHDLRKKIRLCANLVQVTAAENYGKNLHWLFASILELSIMLGEEHDELVRKSLVGEINYDSSRVEIDKTLADKFHSLEPFIKKVVGLF